MSCCASQDIAVGMRQAVGQYESFVKSGVCGRGPFLVASNVPLLDFKRFNQKREDAWRLSYDKSTSEVLLYGDPSPIHEAVSRWFDVRAGVFSMAEEEEVFHSGATSVELASVIKEPDFSLHIAGLMSSKPPCPQIVAEVAHYNEGQQALRRSILEWTNAGFALVALGVLVSGVGKDLKLTFLKGTACSREIEEFEFTAGKCSQEGQQLVKIDLGDLGAGKQLRGKCWELDLLHLQKQILRVDESRWRDLIRFT